MFIRSFFVAVLVALCLTTTDAAGAQAKPGKRILVKKSEHTMQVLGTDDKVLGNYTVSLGPGGAGPKKREGDRVTPVGRYHVTMHQPSQFKIFLRLDYPNAQDWERFQKLKKAGALPDGAKIGGDVGIHGGTPPGYNDGTPSHDWTLGCVAVDDDEIVEIAKLVPDGVIVDIED